MSKVFDRPSTRIAVEPVVLVPGSGREVAGVAPLEERLDEESDERKAGEANQRRK
ncbi:hypothetical protein [Methylobacterium nigriterrae]|uniref:hypothetical protein n=1 Tax=Methylobacterium nigriterrae TaxID=3127512 RepID=UPI003D6660BB